METGSELDGVAGRPVPRLALETEHNLPRREGREGDNPASTGETRYGNAGARRAVTRTASL